MHNPIATVQYLLTQGGLSPPAGQAQTTTGAASGLFAMLLACLQRMDPPACAGGQEGDLTDATPEAGPPLPTLPVGLPLSAGEDAVIPSARAPDDGAKKLDAEIPSAVSSRLKACPIGSPKIHSAVGWER